LIHIQGLLVGLLHIVLRHLAEFRLIGKHWSRGTMSNKQCDQQRSINQTSNNDYRERIALFCCFTINLEHCISINRHAHFLLDSLDDCSYDSRYTQRSVNARGWLVV
jgi:hypothetical protein